MSLTAKELAAIEDQLGVEQTLIKNSPCMRTWPLIRSCAHSLKTIQRAIRIITTGCLHSLGRRRQVSMRQIPFGDREMMEDALASQKFAAHGYNLYANECVSPPLWGS